MAESGYVRDNEGDDDEFGEYETLLPSPTAGPSQSRPEMRRSLSLRSKGGDSDVTNPILKRTPSLKGGKRVIRSGNSRVIGKVSSQHGISLLLFHAAPRLARTPMPALAPLLISALDSGTPIGDKSRSSQ